MHNAARFYLFFCFFFVPTLAHCCVDPLTLAEFRKEQKAMKALARQKLSKPVDAQKLYNRLLLVEKYMSDVPKPEPKPQSKSLPSLPTITKTPPTKREELLRPISILAQLGDEYSSGDERDALVSNSLKPNDFKNYQESSNDSCDYLLNAPSSGESSDDDSLTLSERIKKERKQQKTQKTFSVNNRQPTDNVKTSDKYNIPTSPPGIRRRHPAAQQKQPQYTKNKGD